MLIASSVTWLATSHKSQKNKQNRIPIDSQVEVVNIWVSYLIWRKQNGCAFPSAHPGPPRQSAFGAFSSVNLPDTSGSNGPLELALSMTSRMFLLPPLGMKNSSKSHTATLSATPLAKYEQKLICIQRVRKHQRRSVNLLSERENRWYHIGRIILFIHRL